MVEAEDKAEDKADNSASISADAKIKDFAKGKKDGE